MNENMQIKECRDKGESSRKEEERTSLINMSNQINIEKLIIEDRTRIINLEKLFVDMQIKNSQEEAERIRKEEDRTSLIKIMIDIQMQINRLSREHMSRDSVC